MTNAVESITGHLEEVRSNLLALDPERILAIAELLCQGSEESGTVYCAGNGGCAALANHLACGLAQWGRDPGKVSALKALSLPEQSCSFTAISNDLGHQYTFARMLSRFAKAGDILFVLSASGQSANLVEAALVAHSLDMTVLGLPGPEDAPLSKQVSVGVHVAAAAEVAEDVYSAVIHSLYKALRLPASD